MPDCYDEGRVAYLQHVGFSANPYPMLTERYKLWRDGWLCELDIALESHPLELGDNP